MSRPSTSPAAGLVMPVTLVFLLLSSLVAVVLLQMAQAEQRLSGNLQQHQQSRLLAEALLRALVSSEDAFDPDLSPGSSRCRKGGACGREDLTLSVPAALLPPGAQVAWEVRRLAPAWQTEWPFRRRESVVSGLGMGRLALFEARVTVDARALRGGMTRLAQGVAVREGGGS